MSLIVNDKTEATAKPVNDLWLIQRFAQSRDETVFAEIVRRYAGVVYAAAHRVVHNRALAEEVAQETFLRLMRKPEQVTQSLVGWLHRSSTQLAIDAVRSESARRRREQKFAQDRDHEQHGSGAGLGGRAGGGSGGASGGDDELRWEELSPMIDEALDALPDEQRTLLVRHFLEGVPQRDLARMMNRSPATISRRIQDGLTNLRANLTRRGMAPAVAVIAAFLHAQAMRQAPLTLMQELGKMALAANVSPFFAAAMVRAAVTKALTAPAAAATVLMVGCTVAAIVTGMQFADMMATRRDASMTSTSMRDKTPQRVSVESESRFADYDAIDRIEPVESPILELPLKRFYHIAAAGTLASDVITGFSLIDKRAAGRVLLSYGDGRVESVTLADARREVWRQTGESLEGLASTARSNKLQ